MNTVQAIATISNVINNLRDAAHGTFLLNRANAGGGTVSHVSPPALNHGVPYMDAINRRELAKAEAAAYFDLECE